MTTLTLQPDGASGLDTFMDSANGVTNYGSNAALRVGNDNGAGDETRRSLVKFDLSSIPAYAYVQSAILYLTQTSEEASNARTLYVYRTLRDWVEAQATWTIWKTSNNWSSGGGFHANDCEQTDIGSVSLSGSEANGEKAITLSIAGIQSIVSGTFTNNGFLLKMDTEDNDCHTFASSDHATAGSRPKLVIEYTAGGQVI